MSRIAASSRVPTHPVPPVHPGAMALQGAAWRLEAVAPATVRAVSLSAASAPGPAGEVQIPGAGASSSAPAPAIPGPPLAAEFRQLGPEARQALAAASLARAFGPNDLIYLQDDDADFLYFIRSGHVRLSYLMEDGSAVLCGILPPGESFGELGIFEGTTHCDMATAIGNVSVSAVSLAQFRQLRERHPEIGAAVAQAVARRYRAYVELTRMLSLKTLAARLAQALLRLADGLGAEVRIGDKRYPGIGAMVTQTDLGLMARGARSNVNRALKTWERHGWIAMHERSIIILNRPRLESLALQEEF